MTKEVFIVFVTLLIISCSKEGELFKNPSSKETGITFQNTLTTTVDINILDYLYFYNGGGVAVGDINNDSLPDIFFSGNQVKNKLYLNKGNLQFEDISNKAGITGNSSWNTGTTMADVNGDGLLDIYVCAVVGIKGFEGQNELYINNGDLTFTESATLYGLDFDTYTSSAAFLDYDLDGDLDVYILNHAIHTNESFGKASLRKKRDYQTGDKLLRNDGHTFTDVSEKAGIFGGSNGYGLGIAVADFNQDGYPDVYVGNDFHEDDYYYLNNGDGTFRECLKQYFGHTSRFSMGNDVADLNHDGWPDIISLDMLPENEKILKSSEGDENFQIQKMKIENYGYHYQYTRNMLQINQQNGTYSEVALLSGVAATDWSWSAIFADYNQDGEQDLFISNGIPKRPNDLDYINFVSNKNINKKLNNTKLIDQQALNMMPSGAVHNFIFKGNKKMTFEDMSNRWIASDSLISGATAVGDFDNDGDIDLVINNINSPAALYENKTDNKSNYLKFKLKYTSPNHFGIGTKIYTYHNGGFLQYKELYTTRGFQSSSEPIIHFGYGNAKKVDSVKIVWPNKTYQLLTNIDVNQTLLVTPDKVKPFDYLSLKTRNDRIFEKVKNNLGIDFTHVEDNYIDFNRQKLIPYQVSDRGPAIAIGDLDNDDKDDIFFGGSKYKPSKIFIQESDSFTENRIPSIAKDSINENVTAVIEDFNSDSKNDIFIGSGGGDYYAEMKPLSDNYYVQNDSTFQLNKLPEYFENASVIKKNDFDADGDLDLFVASNAVSNDFGKTPNSYLLKNEKGIFSIVENNALRSAGMITDAIWSDFNNDGVEDLIIVGEWMSPKFFKNNNGYLSEVNLLNEKLHGLWQTITPFDIDNDGDIDYMLGNWGNNSKFKASEKNPLKMYYGDFDNNQQTETVVCIEKSGKYYPLLGLNELSSQIVSLRKKFPSYKSFAGKTIEQIFTKETFQRLTLLEVNRLESGYLKNEKGHFIFIPFIQELQVSPITTFLEFDFDSNGRNEVLAAGNYFGVKPFHGRFDSFSGALIKSEKEVLLGNQIGLDFMQKSVRHLNIITLNDKPYLLVTINNSRAQVYKLNN